MLVPARVVTGTIVFVGLPDKDAAFGDSVGPRCERSRPDHLGSGVTHCEFAYLDQVVGDAMDDDTLGIFVASVALGAAHYAIDLDHDDRVLIEELQQALKSLGRRVYVIIEALLPHAETDCRAQQWSRFEMLGA
jgi:hypothetical protein